MRAELKNREKLWSNTLGAADTHCSPQHATCMRIHQFNSSSVTGSLMVLGPETLTEIEKDEQSSCAGIMHGLHLKG